MKIDVAPLVGARIEISYCVSLKQSACVAPLVGARIEIGVINYSSHSPLVAPLVGARIEISKDFKSACHYASLPSWERGLKSHVSTVVATRLRRSPRGSAD